MSFSPEVIRDAVASGRISPEKGARLLELHYELVAIARKARWKRWLGRLLWWRR